MIYIKEDRAEISKKRVVLPKSFVDFRRKQAKLTPDRYMNTLEGGKTLKSDSAEKEYNARNGVDNNGDDENANTLSISDAKTRKSRMQRLDRNSVEYNLYGGQRAEQLYGDIARRARIQAPVSKVKPVSQPKVRNVPQISANDVKSAAIKEQKRIIHLKDKNLRLLK